VVVALVWGGGAFGVGMAMAMLREVRRERRRVSFMIVKGQALWYSLASRVLPSDEL